MSLINKSEQLIPRRPVSIDCTILVQSNVLYWSLYGNDFHIGVGSDVCLLYTSQKTGKLKVMDAE